MDGFLRPHLPHVILRRNVIKCASRVINITNAVKCRVIITVFSGFRHHGLNCIFSALFFRHNVIKHVTR